ncbi:MAG: hypothetical protein R2911_05825 [Caldilineaceae bacterium]
MGSKAQLPAYRAVAGDLRLAYAQFEEMEVFARFSTRLDEETKHTLAHGRRVREVLKQPQFAPMSAFEQVVALLAVTQGLFDHFGMDKVASATQAILQAVRNELPLLGQRLESGQPLGDANRELICVRRGTP